MIDRRGAIGGIIATVLGLLRGKLPTAPKPEPLIATKELALLHERDLGKQIVHGLAYSSSHSFGLGYDVTTELYEDDVYRNHIQRMQHNLAEATRASMIETLSKGEEA